MQDEVKLVIIFEKVQSVENFTSVLRTSGIIFKSLPGVGYDTLAFVNCNLVRGIISEV